LMLIELSVCLFFGGTLLIFFDNPYPFIFVRT
jgi:hypothetical protein